MNKKYLFLLIGLVSVIVYFNSLNNLFVFDDESVVQNNSSITSLSNIPKFFTADEGFHKVIGKYYRPIVSTTYTIDYAIWGMNAFGFHLSNIIFHLIASLLLLAILLNLFKDFKFGIVAAQVGALIFAVHPIHTEAVSWISGRTDSLVTLFFFLSFYGYIKFISEDESKNKLWLIISVFAFFIGLLTKEMIITLPVILILFDFVYRKKNLKYLKQNLQTYSIFFGVAFIYLVLRYFLLKDIPDRLTYNYFYGKDVSVAIFTMLKTVPVYFKLLIFPINLLYHYNGTLSDAVSLFDTKVLLSVISIISLFAASFMLFKKYSEISFAIYFFFVTLIPVMNIIPTMNFMAERFLYMTSFGLSITVGIIIVKFLTEKNRVLILAPLVLILVAYSFLTFERNKDWKDNDTLYSTADGVDGSVLLVNAGNIYANKKNFDEAEKRYRRAIEIRDNSVLAHHNLGLIYLIKGNLDSAEIKFKKGISIDSLAPDGYFQLANLYRNQGKIPEAISMLEKLQTVSPNYRDSKSMLDMLIQNPTAENLNPEKGDALNIQILETNSFKLYQEGKFKESIKALEKLIKMNPKTASGYYNNIAICYGGLNDYEKAEINFQNALNSDPNNTYALGGLADIYMKDNNHSKAKEMLNKILMINPDDINVKNKLDSLNKIGK